MYSIEKLRKATTLAEFAHILGYKPKSLSYIVYKIPDGSKYTEFTIPKKSGAPRTIKAPDERLKHLQRRLADLLNKCFEELCALSKHKKSLSHGFRSKHSIVTNAINHRNKRYVFNVDLKDFFPSINFGRVYGFFIKNAHFGLDRKVATIIAQIACHNNELPQGSPCSPVISNFIGHLLDIRMVNLAKKAKCTYSRYADDLTFSTNNKEFPKEIAIKVRDDVWMPGEILVREIEKVGFRINSEKISMQYKTSRQVTTGLVVNKKVNVKNEYYRKARSMCHELFTTDKYYIDATLLDTTGEGPVLGTMNQLEGVLGFIYQIKRTYDDGEIGKRRYHPTAITKLFREFLFYKYFFSLDKPLILCEGKTDVIYLKCALKQLIGDYSEFAEPSGDGVKYKIGFLTFSRNIKDVFSVSEGAPGLASIMDVYEKHMRPFKGEGKKHPVVILIDNDKGSAEIKKKLKIGVFAKPFYRYVENLYIIPIPSPSGAGEVTIEQLFEKKVLDVKIDGKQFSTKPMIDPKTEYGKIVFANKVIKNGQDKINYDGFKGILNCLRDVIADYSKTVQYPA